ncbi:MAG: hypothetical protein Q4G42_01740 [Neisseria sp.]|nr:hypothetical protein [Neisseria sp.]
MMISFKSFLSLKPFTWVSMIAWLAYAWSWLAALTMSHYAFSWVLQLHNPLRHELLAGFTLGMLYGLPAFLGLLILPYFKKNTLNFKGKFLWYMPLMVSVISWVTLRIMGVMN